MQDIESLRRMGLSVALDVVAKGDERIVAAMHYAMEIATQMQAEIEERGIQKVLRELQDLHTRAGAAWHRYVTLVAERDWLRGLIPE